ncbi:hypothetical protein LPAF129_01910 [Ligilactobacillus pabuli]|uniref:Uncharacterized protein n=1 Tax=Ligilactobacillus pabuli TaxID=2886039 RepID=A0ABQ5JF85_9LACO|nr:hypothetical protein [Ligilactobacillus pabuli]GKS80506.1 hypothetical protein LPAF129_01910 [Ligilactobacillus pabuli]
MKIEELDVVKLKDGREGAIVYRFDDDHFMFEAKDDYDLKLPTISMSDIEEVTWKVSEH